VPRERIPDVDENAQRALFGPMDRYLRQVRERWGVRVSARRGVLLLESEDDAAVREVGQRISRVLERLRAVGDLPPDEIEALLFDRAASAAETAPATPVLRPPTRAPGRDARRAHPRAPLPRPLAGTATGGDLVRGVEPRTAMQERYVRSIRSRDVVFSIGPAGTGKTYLAVAEAVASLRANATRRIVLTRPAVEAGEKLGFLPGDYQAKINPYLRPLYDALGDLLPFGEVQRYVDADVIEIVPLAYMRGRTLKSAFIILDEAQNTTPAQMKMFLTRMGSDSKVVVTGDVTQVDLPEGTTSGLIESIRILEGIRGIDVIRFEPADILRHPLVQRIVDAYDRDERLRRGDVGEGPVPRRRARDEEPPPDASEDGDSGDR
jgi:phosphate starvation-inducible PhoH-like protein